jgi:lipopolysaccharide transport system ATP-binding protein
MKPIVEVTNLSKSYRLGSLGVASFQEAVGGWFSGKKSAGTPNTFWALREVSFSVPPGEVLGLVGRNGAGKSTLLRILSRITKPTSGRAVLRGRVASLLEVGTGFHPDLTGRENIYLNGAILGMKRAEIARQFDAIVAFSGVEQFLDTPVKRYSSGMYVRLAFAVAAHLESEILIVDEVLAVGDAEFQKKCLGKMREVTAEGRRTVLFVSHNMAAVQTLCDRVVLIEGGRVTAIGEPGAVLPRYLRNGGESSHNWERPSEAGTKPLQFETADLRLDDGRLTLDLRLSSRPPHRPAFVAIDVLNSMGAAIMQAVPTVTPFITDAHAAHALRLTIDLPPLIPGSYALTLWTGAHNSETFDCIESALAFEIDISPTPNRTVSHSPDHGYIVPHSSCDYSPVENASPIAALH